MEPQMEPQVESAAISYSEATTIAGYVAIAVGISKNPNKGLNPSQQAYTDICANPDYQLLLDPSFSSNYTVLYNILMPETSKGNSLLSYFGFIAVNNHTFEYVVSIRGTMDGFEALEDADFIPVGFKEYNKQGLVPQGFYAVFEAGQVVSLQDRTTIPLSQFATNISKYLPRVNNAKVTVTGHSLGSAVATYFAAAATVTLGKSLPLSLYTFASPFTGDKNFTGYLSNHLAESVRVFNIEDKVPTLPYLGQNGQNIYTHVIGGAPVDSTGNLNINRNLLKNGLGCTHQLPVYEYLLQEADGNDNPKIIAAGGDGRCLAQ